MAAATKATLKTMQEKPAIIIAAFGSSRRGRSAFAMLEELALRRFSGHRLYWGYTSEIIRRKTGNPSLTRILEEAAEAGCRQAVVLPLQVFPGSEYQRICEIAGRFASLQTVVGETLMHRWSFAREVVDAVSVDFLEEEEGVNLLALHGTRLAADPANIVYLGLAQQVRALYGNVWAASLEGVPDHRAVIREIDATCGPGVRRRLRIIPMMYIAGLHVEDDLMGEEDSWKCGLEARGWSVECPGGEDGDGGCYKSLAAYPQIQEFFLQRIDSALQRLRQL